MNSRSGASSPPASALNIRSPDAALRPAYKAVVERLLRSRRPHADSRPSARHSSGHGRFPLSTRRSSTRAMPRVSVGKSGPIRAHCASENQKKSDISIASSLETMNHASPALGIPLMGPDPNTKSASNEFTSASHTCRPARPSQFFGCGGQGGCQPFRGHRVYPAAPARSLKTGAVTIPRANILMRPPLRLSVPINKGWAAGNNRVHQLPSL